MSRKILKIRKPSIKHGFYVVHFDFGTGTGLPVYMTAEGFAVLMAEEKLIKKGALQKDLEDYKETIFTLISSKEEK